MQLWNAYIQLNGDGVSIFSAIEFKVPEKLYTKMQKTIEKGKPLCSLSFYEELCERAQSSFDLAEYLGYNDEKPIRDDYDDRDEFLEAMDEYQEMVDGLWDDYYLESLIIDDPGDLNRFKDHLLGKVYPPLAGKEEVFECESYDETCARYSATVRFDENGIITDVTQITAEGLEGESVRSSRYGDAYPDYDLLEETIYEELGLK